MAEAGKSPPKEVLEWVSSWKEQFNQLRTQFGVRVAVLLILLVAALAVWWYWDELAKRPGIGWLLARFRRKSLPSAPPGPVTIAVAHLDRDKDEEHETLLLGELRALESAEVQRVDRTIEWPTAGTESTAKTQAEMKARALVERTRADVLIWGYVQKIGEQSAMQLYWTPRETILGI